MALSSAGAAEPPIMDWPFHEEPVLKVDISDRTDQVVGQLWPGEKQGVTPKLVTEDVPCGTAWDFGDSDCIFAVTSDPNIQLLGDTSQSKGMAFAFWVKKDNADELANYLRVFGLSPLIDCTASKDALTFMTRGEPVGAKSSLIADTNGMWWSTAAAKGVLDGAWHHVAFSANYASADSNVAVFVDGQEVESVSVDFSKMTEMPPAKFFFIGGRLNAGNRWTGAIGRFQAWNRPLEEGEAAAIYAAKGAP